MRYVSTSGSSQATLAEAVAHCFAPDGCLYLPERLPVIPRAFFNNIEEMSLTEVAYVVATTLMGDDVGPAVLKTVVESALNFPIPMVDLGGDRHILELFHGPTLAFKDISARFLAQTLRVTQSAKPRNVTILTATTGNTGAAIANAFANLDGTRVMVLYPQGAMSHSELARFAVGSNIVPLEVSGTIGQCKKMVRQACEDADLAEKTVPLCVNTHNILRILPQIAIFFHAYAQLKAKGLQADGFSVAIPCGNLSNLTAAVMAKKMGLPIGRIVAGCSANDEFVRVVNGTLSVDEVGSTSRRTLARAMDSGYPTNLRRLMRLYDDNLGALRADIEAHSLDDDAIASVISRCNADGYVCDPHTAVAVGAMERAGLSSIPSVVLATAHPSKSADAVNAALNREAEPALQPLRPKSRPVFGGKIAPTYQALKKVIISNI